LSDPGGGPPRRAVAFVGLGRMGLPMARRLLEAGFAVRGSDLAAAARHALAAQGGEAFATAAEAAEGAAMLVTMLPDGAAVEAALLGPGGAAAALPPGALAIDMSSSAPLGTRRLGEALAARRIALIDAPVSGGVARAAAGTLAIMAGGAAAEIDRAMPLLQAMGRAVFRTGPLGSGHAMKALNNYVSAAGLAAASEALLVGRRFGLDPEIMVEVLNASTGRNNSTETKLKPFVLSGSFASGFSMALMAKDIRTAADLAAALDQQAPGLERAAALWEQAGAVLGKDADHTAIYRYLAAVPPAGGDS
jgi:3-hydroxyisobutyrate dehydrogenase